MDILIVVSPRAITAAYHSEGSRDAARVERREGMQVHHNIATCVENELQAACFETLVSSLRQKLPALYLRRG